MPLWFGNQWNEKKEGPAYGTARVVDYLRALKHTPRAVTEPLIRKGCEYLEATQHADGGWGGTGQQSSIEETALAIKALASDGSKDVIERAMKWLTQKIDTDGDLAAAPIGLYFAELWYSERLYPLIFALDALEMQKTRIQN